MPRLQHLLECLSVALRDHASGPLLADAALGASLGQVARRVMELHAARGRNFPLRGCLQDAISVPSHTLALSTEDALGNLLPQPTEALREAMVRYLSRVPDAVRQAVRRPGDFVGSSVPEHLPLDAAEDLLALLPDRPARFREDDQPELLDNWRLRGFRGLGTSCETWLGEDDSGTPFPTACLKFVVDPRLREGFERHEGHFVRILDLDPIPTVIPLRSVYLLTDPPCLEYPYFHGYDLAGVMNDWRWRGIPPRPDQAILVIRRLARAVAKLHRLAPPVVHGGLKPSNILATPGDDGKVTLLISDLGWGLLATLGGLEPADPEAERRAALRGSLSRLYASPQVRDGQIFGPRDDVYALGMIWYQLLCRDPAAPPPVDTSWAMAFREHGLTDGQARLIGACISPRADYRPRDAGELAAQIEANLHLGLVMEGSKTFQLSGSSSHHTPLRLPDELPDEPATPPARGNSAGPPPLGGGPAVGAASVSSRTPLPAARGRPTPGLPARLVNSLGMGFALIPAGGFWMGSPEGERGRHGWEGPRHQVRLTRPFYLGVTPVTQGQYTALLGRNPSGFTKLQGCGPDHPVEQVSWDDAVEFCQRLTQLPQEAQQFRVYRLPTEAEWEYACRADTQTPYAFGATLSQTQAHFFGMDASNWKKEVSLVGKTCKVASYPPNLWQLCDMHGNVLEWCLDYWSDDTYENSPEADPTGPEQGAQRVVRGGCFSQFATECRSAARLSRPPQTRANTIGFRVLLEVGGNA